MSIQILCLEYYQVHHSLVLSFVSSDWLFVSEVWRLCSEYYYHYYNVMSRTVSVSVWRFFLFFDFPYLDITLVLSLLDIVWKRGYLDSLYMQQVTWNLYVTVFVL